MNQIKRIPGRQAEIGEGMALLRFLPQRQQRMIGAWCFLDHAGPVEFAAGHGMRVGAHPHIGLQTFTWMLEGEVMHTDSLGNQQIIRPGQVNLMTAGYGISHTEDSLPASQRLHAAQLWIALPPEFSAIAPAFAHHADIAVWQEQEVQLSLLVGEYGGRTSTCRVYSPLLALDLKAAQAQTIRLNLVPAFEYGVLVLKGSMQIENQTFDETELAYLPVGGQEVKLSLAAGTQVLLIGGEPFAQPILMWWNFVGYSKHEIAQAQHQWEAGAERFGSVAKPDARRLVAPALLWREE